MAFNSTGWEMTITVVDNGENKVTRRFAMTAAVHADVVTEAAIILAAFEAVCAAGTVAYSYKEVFANDALVVPASSAVQCEAQALLVMRDSVNPLKMHTITIPAPETDVFMDTSGDLANIVDITHADVLAYAALFDSAGEAYISDGESIAVGGLIRGRRVTRGAGRG